MNTPYPRASFEEAIVGTDNRSTGAPAIGTKLPGETYSPKSLGPKYPPHDMSAPVLSGSDIGGMVAAIVMALGPLSAYAAGWGL